jgi:hypothetical protein
LGEEKGKKGLMRGGELSSVACGGGKLVQDTVGEGKEMMEGVMDTLVCTILGSVSLLYFAFHSDLYSIPS